VIRAEDENKPMMTTVAPEAPERGFFAASRTALHLAVVFMVWCAVYVPGLFSPALLDDADSEHAEVAREMLLRHDWVTMYTDGVRYLQKAPLMYWGMAASFKTFGVGEWQARLPLALSVLALLVCVYFLGRHAYGPRGGFWSAVVLGTTVGPFLFTRFIIPDIIVGLWLAIGCYCFLKMLERPDNSLLYAWGFAAAAALDVLTKGLIGIVFPGAIVFFFLLVTGKMHLVRKMHVLSGSIVLLVIAAPWHILAAIRNPPAGQERGFLWFYFVNEQFLRYLNERYPHDYNTVPLLVFWGLIFIWLMPWSAFLPSTVRRIRFRRSNIPSDRRETGTLLFATWSLVILVFFSFSTRQSYYLVPALPGIALLIGGWLGRESSPQETAARQGGVWASWVLAVIGVVVAAVAAVIFATQGPPPPGTSLSTLLTQHPRDYTFSMGHILDLTPRSMSVFRLPLVIFALSFGLGTVGNLFFRRKGKPGAGNAVLAGMMVGILTASWLAFVTFSPILSSKQLALAINRVYQPGDTIVIRGQYENGSTLNFYTGHQVHILHGRVGQWYGSLFPDAPKIWETNQSIRVLWQGKARVFLWSTVGKPPELEGLPIFVLARSGGKFILTNQS
jgi:4-amino-4-deoxy-L-arabinose transferase-like glycosyltransferase